MNETAPLASHTESWRNQDSLDILRKYHQDNCRGIGMSGWTGDSITPACLLDVIEAARETLDSGEALHRPQLAEHLDDLIKGLEYEQKTWEQTGTLKLLPYSDGWDKPHMFAFSAVCDRVREDAGNKKKKQRRRSQAAATSTTK